MEQNNKQLIQKVNKDDKINYNNINTIKELNRIINDNKL